MSTARPSATLLPYRVRPGLDRRAAAHPAFPANRKPHQDDDARMRPCIHASCSPTPPRTSRRATPSTGSRPTSPTCGSPAHRTRSARSCRTWCSGRSGSPAAAMARPARCRRLRRRAGSARPAPRGTPCDARLLVGLERLVSLAADADGQRRIDPPIEFPPLAQYTVADVVVHVGVHNAHHLGQVVLLRQLLGAWPPPAGSYTW